MDQKPPKTVNKTLIPQFDTKRLRSLSSSAAAHPILRRIALPLFCLALGFGGGWLGAATRFSDTPSPAMQRQYVSSESQLIASIAKNTGPSVVSVETTSPVVTEGLLGYNQQSTQQSAGTGFVISSDGLIVTNRHVIPANASKISVTLSDGTRYDGVTVVGRTSAGDPLDVAFLRINDLKGKKLQALTLGDSSKMQVGDNVIAIGNALGQFQNTVTAGIISGYGRDVTASDQTGATSENLTDLFQTDAAINEGNSGGPLVDMNGEVIGLNTAVASGAQSIGFAIPINDVKGLIEKVLATGKLVKPYLGVHYVSITNDLSYQYDLKVTQGAYVIPRSISGQPPVVEGSPAAKAGIRGGDIITKVDDVAIDQKTSLSGALTQFDAGETINITVIRDGKTLKLKATLTQAPDS